MKISYIQVQTKQFAQALGKLATHGGFTDYKQLANIKSFLKQFEKVSDTAQKEWIDLLKTYCDRDEKGNFIPGSNGPGTFRVTAGKEADFEAAQAFFNAKEVDVWADPIPFEACTKVGLSAADLIQLDGIIVEPKDFTDAQKGPEAATA